MMRLEQRQSLIVIGVFTGALALLCGLGILAIPDIPSGADNDESLAVLRSVDASGVIPDHATAAREASTSRRFVLVYGVEDEVTQESILRIAREARRLHSTRPVDVMLVGFVTEAA